MIKHKKLLIGEAIAVIVIISLVVSIFFIDFDLGIFKIVSCNTLFSKYNTLKDMDSKLLSTKLRYTTAQQSVNTSIDEYTKQKNQYNAITDETIAIIKEATVDEKYNIEYMWIKLGNYATSNNLTLTIVEPGGKLEQAPPDTNTETKQVTNTETTQSNQTDSKEKSSTDLTINNNLNNSSSANELTIKVDGNYTNVSQFIFELENDKELRFKLDKIKMEYAGSNKITASFVVKKLVFKK
ncbi:MAG: hypothetical protein RR290_03155 [Clostridia bacterium]